ncbi:hypothetical protein F4801DRAFT_597827 [Xylaria longipes]|nr:hypothetical protein F4801DRAFT_597827 [Xylaria longipes]
MYSFIYRFPRPLEETTTPNRSAYVHVSLQQSLQRAKEPLGTNTIATMPTLVTLPTEMICKICDHLVPDVIVTGATLPLPDEHQLCQRALWSLALVSDHVGGIATEFLYKNVVIQSTKQMVCLFRTISGKPNLRRHAHYLANLVPLMDPGLQAEIEADIQRHCPFLPAIVTSITKIYPRELYQLDSPELFSSKPLWTHEIVRYMHPDEAFCAETPRPPPFSGEPRTLRMQLGPLKSIFEDEALGLPLFQLYFTPFMSNGCRVTDLRFLNLANITSYKIYDSCTDSLDVLLGPGGLVRSEKNRGLLCWLAQLKALDLGYSAINPRVIGQLLTACINLKELTWDYCPWPCRQTDSSHVELALQQTAGRLEQLDLQLDCLHGPISFRQFQALKILSVGIEVLTNYSREPERTSDDPATPSIVETPLASLLPNSLNRLTLLSKSIRTRGNGRRRDAQTAAQLHYRDIMDGYVAHGRQLFPTWLADGLEVFSGNCQAMPNLHSITVRQPFHGVLPVDHIRRIEIGDLTAKFGAVGVRFSTELTTSEDY